MKREGRVAGAARPRTSPAREPMQRGHDVIDRVAQHRVDLLYIAKRLRDIEAGPHLRRRPKRAVKSRAHISSLRICTFVQVQRHARYRPPKLIGEI